MSKILYTFMLLFVFKLSLLASTAQENLGNEIKEPKTIITYEEATNDSNVSKWNIKDFHQNNSQQRTDTGTIGSSQAEIRKGAMGEASLTVNPYELQTNELLKNENIKNIPAMTAFDDNLRAETIAKASTNSFVSINKEDKTIECFITRDIPFQYQCEKTGLVYGGGMSEGGAWAKRECQNNCFEQFDCANVSQENETQNLLNQKIITFTKGVDNNFTTTDAGEFLDESIVTDKIKYAPSFFKEGTLIADENLSVVSSLLDIYLIYPDGQESLLVEKLLIKGTDQPQTLMVNARIKGYRFDVFKNDETVDEISFSVSLITRGSEKWICPEKQDITGYTAGEFAHLCPSGNVIDFSMGFTSFKVCADAMNYGDNSDGTFSKKESCESICRIPFSCKPTTQVFSTAALETFREGCIQGQLNCEDELCEQARLAQVKVREEIVFDATKNFRKTVTSSAQIENTNRPRIVLREDKTFLERSKEEWKDNAYKNMTEQGTYSYTKNFLDEDTEDTQAYGSGVRSGVAYGKTGTSSRSLYFKYKPKAFDVNVDENKYVYAFFRVYLDYYAYNPDGKKEIVRDEAWYFKTSESDTFKATRRTYDYAQVVGSIVKGTEITINEHTSPEDKTFNGTSWTSISSSELAPYFKIDNYKDAEYHYRYRIVNSMGELINEIPGIAKRRDSFVKVAPRYYTGVKDGTAESISKFIAYGFVSKTQLKLSEIYEKVANDEIKPIYESISPQAYTSEIRGDEEGDENILNIFHYGTVNNKSAFTTITPRENDVGKKAFIFVFVN